MVDPNCDLVFIQHGIPLSIDEIQMLGDDLSAYVDWGPAARYQMTFEHIRDFIRNNLLRGVCFRHRSIWPRSDFISHPENSPPGHGSITYCESDLVWESKDLSEGFGMFRYFASPEYFTAPPDFKVYD